MFFLPVFSYAQQRTEVRGNVISFVSGEFMKGVLVSLKRQHQQIHTDERGIFYFQNVSPGRDTLILNSVRIRPLEIPVNIVSGIPTVLENIRVTDLKASVDLSLVGIVDEEVADDDMEGSSQEVSSTVILSNDVYLNRVAYQLSPLRFRVRGYDGCYERKYINGVNFNDQLRGIFNYSSVGALNDVTRNGDVTNNSRPGSFTFGALGGTENINMRPSMNTAGTKVTLSYTNRNYYLRGMVTYSSGLNHRGWAFTASVGGRYADRGNIEGTFYRNLAYSLAVEKQWGEGRHSLSLTTFGSPVQRGQQGASYQEVYDLIRDNLYNPNWGYQNGKRRNAKVVKAFDPTAILSHVWKIREQTTLTTGIGFHYGRYGNTALNWYNGPDPRPDYYRYLPSYFEDVEVVTQYTELWKRKSRNFTQINWDRLYEINSLNNRLGDGGAIYMVEERRSDLYETSFNSTLNSTTKGNMKLTAGIGLRATTSRQFKTVDDLLGAKYVLDIDKFAERDFSGEHDKLQNDLNRPDRRVFENGIFGYNFNLNVYSANAWVLNQYNARKLDFYYGFKLTHTYFQREGKMRNGRYPANSYGKGREHSFTDMTLKGGVTYKINGRHFLTGNISYGTEAPLPNTAYISPRITDKTIVDLKSGRILAADLNYVFSLSSLTGRLSVFQTNFYDQMERYGYYDDVSGTFVNHVLTGVNRIHRGIETGMTYRIDNHWSLDFAGTVAEYYYGNHPMGSMNAENGTIDNELEKVYMKNCYVGGTPQFAGTLGIRYFINYWFLGINFNGFGRNYIEVAPLRRRASNYASVDPTIPEQLAAYRKLNHQERFDEGYTLDLSIGKIFYLPGKKSVNFNLSVNNLLNREDIRTGGYEQGRTNMDYPERFGSKYYYMQGINSFLNVSYRF